MVTVDDSGVLIEVRNGQRAARPFCRSLWKAVRLTACVAPKRSPVDNLEVTKCQRRQLYIQGFQTYSLTENIRTSERLIHKNQKQRWLRARGHLDERCERLPDDHTSTLLQQGNHGQYRLHRGYSKRFQDPDRPPREIAIERRNTPAGALGQRLRRKS